MYDLKDIIGHENIKEYIHNSQKSGKIPHAFIFVGDKGCGKMLTAKTFAKILQCREDAYSACNKCRSCLQMETDNQPDVIVVQKSSQNINIKDIRTQLTGDVQVKPYAGPYKIYIVPEAHKLREDAQNALLKTIEEPPEYAIIILLTENIDSLLPTIQSRCVTLQFKMIDTVKIKKYLMEQYAIPDYAAEASAIFAEGNIGRAIKYAENEVFIEMRESVIKLMSRLDELTEYNVLRKAKEIAEYKENIVEYVDLLQLWLRDVLVYKSTRNSNMLLFRNEQDVICKQAQKVSYAYLDRALLSVDKVKQSLKLNVNAELALEVMLVTLKDM